MSDVPILTCSRCGHEFASIDDAYCPQCGTFVEHLRRVRPKPDWEEDRAWMSRAILWLEARVKPSKLVARKPPGRPLGQSITLPELEAAVDKLRADHDALTQRRLAAECHIGLTQLTDYLADHPGTWRTLQMRHRRIVQP